jgi:Predicted pPIWI-associating nuclease
MGAAEYRSDSWQSFVESLDTVERAIARVSAVNVNALGPRDTTRGLIQQYFREARPDLIELGLNSEEVQTMDGAMQSLLQLANGRNPKRSYTRVLRAARTQAQELELLREIRLGEARGANRGSTVVISDIESRILTTLSNLVPTAALSYDQAIRDLAATDRISYRGTANELREALRETVDRLAPDHEVVAAPGFSFEVNQTTPTQRQKVRHILVSRRMSATARRVPEESVSLVEALTSSIARAEYQRTSLATHVASTQQEVRQLKSWVDALLAELLQVHA